MKGKKGLEKHLKSIIKVLKEEKDALIQSDGNRIGEIVEEKNQFIESLSEYERMDIENNEPIMALIEEIDSLQELNLLLTKQALGFQVALLESISKGLKNSNTYSAKGDYESSKNIGLIDHSV